MCVEGTEYLVFGYASTAKELNTFYADETAV
jgi:hypothetical protein